MPIYDYRCDECGHRFSAVQSFSDSPLEKCPNCGKRPRRLITAPGIVFKGTGWYKTDSRGAPKDGDGPSGGGDSSEKQKPGEKKDAKAETRSEAKKDTKAETKPSTEGGAKTEAKPKTSDQP